MFDIRNITLLVTALLEGLNSKVNNFSCLFDSAIFGKLDMVRTGYLRVLHGSNDSGMVTISQSLDTWHDALNVNNHQVNAAGHDWQLLREEVG